MNPAPMRGGGGKVGMPIGVATSIGSLPHLGAVSAAEFILARHPHLPAVPSLPRRSAAEGMLAQAAAGVAGVGHRGDGSLAVDGDALDPSAPVVTDLSGPAWRGLNTFLTRAAGRVERVKWQLTGPVTFAFGLVHAGVRPALALDLAASAVVQRALALRDAIRERLGPVLQVAFVDEPSLARVAHPGFPFTPEHALGRVADVFAALGPDVVSGLHCCGHAPFAPLLLTGAQVLSVPAEPGVVASATAVGEHLERGGWVAWGAIPTHEPIGDGADRLWRQLSDLWCALVRAGCDPVLLRTQALITPACGLALHGVSQADRVIGLTWRLAQRVGEQAVATRMSLGA